MVTKTIPRPPSSETVPRVPLQVIRLKEKSYLLNDKVIFEPCIFSNYPNFSPYPKIKKWTFAILFKSADGTEFARVVKDTLEEINQLFATLMTETKAKPDLLFRLAELTMDQNRIYTLKLALHGDPELNKNKHWLLDVIIPLFFPSDQFKAELKEDWVMIQTIARSGEEMRLLQQGIQRLNGRFAKHKIIFPRFWSENELLYDEVNAVPISFPYLPIHNNFRNA